MITETNEFRIQTPEPGNVLEWEGIYSNEVALASGMPEWNEVLDTGQIEPVTVEVVE